MISNYIFALLAQDSVDSDAATVLPALQARMDNPNLTANDVPDYAYTSLKTLLGEQASVDTNTYGQPGWAVRRIIDPKEEAKFRRIDDPDSWPVIFLKVQGLQPDPKAVGVGRHIATLDVLVQTNANQAASAQAYSILQRIIHLITDYTASGVQTPKEIATAVTGPKGLMSLQLFEPQIPTCSWDTQRALFPVRTQLIQ